MLLPQQSLDIAVHAATLLATADAARWGCAGAALVVSTAHELMLHELQPSHGEHAGDHSHGRTLGHTHAHIAAHALKRLGGGYDMPAATLLRPGGHTLLVADLHPAQHQFTLYAADVHNADRRHAEPLLRASGQPLQMALCGSTLFYADHHHGALMAVELDSPSTLLPRVALNQLESPVGVVLGCASDGAGFAAASAVEASAAQPMLVSERRSGRLSALYPDLQSGGSFWQVEREELHSPRLLSIDPISGEVLVPQFATFGYVQSLNLRSGRLKTLLRLASHQRPLAAWRVGELLVVAETGGVRAWRLDEAQAALRGPSAKARSPVHTSD